MRFDGPFGRTILLLSTLLATSILAWHGTIDGQAYVGVIGIILGGIVHASGTKQGSDVLVKGRRDVD